MKDLWKDEMHVERLLELNAQGLSASQISRGLGGEVSRNSVIGKLNRLGVRLMGHSDGRPTAPRTINKRTPSPKPKPVVVLDLSAPEFLGPIGAIPDDKMKTCRYPQGDTSTDSYQMCANPGFPFCPYHHSICYDQTRTIAANKASLDRAQDRQMRRMGL